MILGAGIYQAPLIKKAKGMGLFVIVSSINGKYPGFDFSDRNYYVDTTDKERILEIAKQEGIDGICTTGTDVAVPTIGYVCDNMNLPGISYDDACTASNKFLMKKAFKEHCVTTADFFLVKDPDSFREGFNRINESKAIAKIVDKSGSRGIVVVDKDTDFDKLFDTLIKQTNKDYFLIEQYIEGMEIGIDAFVVDGKAKLIIPHDKLVYLLNGVGIPSGHIVPSEYSDTINQKIVDEVNKIVKAYNIHNGALNIDAFIKDNDVYIIEAGARCGATGIPEIISASTGIDYYKQIINASLGIKCEVDFTHISPCASMLIFSDKTGSYNGIDLPSIDGMTYEMNVKKGDHVLAVEDGTDRIGQIIVSASDRDKLLRKIETIRNGIRLDIV